MIKREFVGRTLAFGLCAALTSCGQALNAAFPNVQVVEMDASSLFGDVVRATIQNTGSEGSVIIYVKQSGKIICVRRTYMNEDERRAIRIDCPELSSGQFEFIASPTNLAPSEIAETATSL